MVAQTSKQRDWLTGGEGEGRQTEMPKENVNLEISLLEAALGLEPLLPVAKKMIADAKQRERLLTRHFSADLAGDFSPESLQRCLQVQRVKRCQGKRHALGKAVHRSLKKAKAFAVQRLVRRIKEDKDDGIQLQSQLVKVKELGIEDLTKQAVLQLRLSFEEPGESTPLSGNPLFDSAAFKKDFAAVQKELSEFCQNIFAVRQPPQLVKAEKIERNPTEIPRKRGITQESRHFDDKKRRTIESRFVGSLSKAAASSSSDPSQPTTNRMGQRARRALAEKLHGSQAKHLQKREEFKPRVEKKLAVKRSAPIVEKMHPSWEAKKLERQKLAKAQFSGKKVTFSDADD